MEKAEKEVKFMHGEQKTLLKRYYDKVGRLVQVFKDKIKGTYEIQVQLLDKNGNSMLVSSDGFTVSMLCYTYRDRESCMKELKTTYARETKILDD